MRIIAGIAKGRNLFSPKGSDTRPLTGRAKEALFSSIGGIVEDAAVLDLFAGTGSVGLEALSRGAVECIFVEQHPAAIAILHRNIAAVGLGGKVVRANVLTYTPGQHASFAFVMVDPPYAMSDADIESIIESVAPALARGGVLVVHRHAKSVMPEVLGSLSLEAKRRYGDGVVWRYSHGATHEEEQDQ